MQRVISDHFPICLMTEGIMCRPCPFMFDEKWLRLDEFRDKVMDWWEATYPTSNASFRIIQRLKHIKLEKKKMM